VKFNGIGVLVSIFSYGTLVLISKITRIPILTHQAEPFLLVAPSRIFQSVHIVV